MEIKHCPFCEAEARLVDIIRQEKEGGCRFVIICNGCGGQTAYYSKIEYALEAWNRRPSPSEPKR